MVVVGENITAILSNFSNELIPGKKYEKNISFKNTSTIDEYAKVEIYNYFTAEEGNKVRDENLQRLKLDLITNGWIVDEESVTSDRTVMYYTKPVKPNEEIQVLESISATPELLYNVEYNSEQTSENELLISTKKVSEGVRANIEIHVDIISTHNGADMIFSAWGVKAEVAEDGTIISISEI